MTKKTKVKVIYIYNDDHLPVHGWMHACSMCDLITSHTKFYSQVEKKNRLYEFHVFLCPYCKRQTKHSLKKRMEYYKSTQSYIKKLLE